ncbi:hypothetical protein G9A89_007979 [Geosiphon pyriformis]|nr:hypothetical protein G9A89_007979 [Geosiphon pyriformis]
MATNTTSTESISLESNSSVANIASTVNIIPYEITDFAANLGIVPGVNNAGVSTVSSDNQLFGTFPPLQVEPILDEQTIQNEDDVFPSSEFKFLPKIFDILETLEANQDTKQKTNQDTRQKTNKLMENLREQFERGRNILENLPGSDLTREEQDRLIKERKGFLAKRRTEREKYLKTSIMQQNDPRSNSGIELSSGPTTFLSDISLSGRTSFLRAPNMNAQTFLPNPNTSMQNTFLSQHNISGETFLSDPNISDQATFLVDPTMSGQSTFLPDPNNILETPISQDPNAILNTAEMLSSENSLDTSNFNDFVTSTSLFNVDLFDQDLSTNDLSGDSINPEDI